MEGKRFIGSSEEGFNRDITAQVCDVNKALLSVKKALKAGHRVVFDDDGSYIEENASGEKMWLKEDANGMFILKLWVKKSQTF